MKKNKILFIFLLLTSFILTISSCTKDGNNDQIIDTAVKDIDGNIYKTVTIGTQVWMAENLKVTKYNDGTVIPNVTLASNWSTQTIGAYCTYDNNEGYVTTYGRLYNWFAVNTGKLAPVGWRVPTSDDWNSLAVYLGGSKIAGGKLKAVGSAWSSPNTGATNETGFTALPGGERLNNGNFGDKDGGADIANSGFFWSSSVNTVNGLTVGYSYASLSEYDSSLDINYYLLNYDFNVISFYPQYSSLYNDANARYGMSVRCIKN